MIRVKNEETILLGGLEESNVNDTGSGVPGLARVPVLKWLFSNRNKSRSKTKLLLLIKPTVLY
jgi:type IV pilus assembly protein PilQ